MLLLLITMNCVATSALAAEAKTLQVQRTDIHVDSARPLAGERSRMAIDAQGRVYFTYTLTAGKETYLPLGTINPDGTVHLDAVGSETTWNVEGWGTVGWPSDLAIDQKGNLHYATRYHGQPYGVDYWLRQDGRWSLESFGHGMTFGGNTVALGLLPDGQPVVLSLDSNRTKLRVWEKRNNQWVSTLPPQLAGVSAGDYDMVVGTDGSLWVVFAAGGASPTIATRNPQGQWSRETIGPARKASMFSMSTDHEGRLHLAYSARMNADKAYELRYATRAPSGPWKVRTLATAMKEHHVGRTDLAASAGTVAIVWEEGPGPRLIPKDYGNIVGHVKLSVIDAAGKLATHTLATKNAGRPSIALSRDGSAAHVGIYSGNDAGDDFYLLSVGLHNKPAPKLTPPTTPPADILAQACLHEIESGNPTAVTRGIERLDVSRITPTQRRGLIEQLLAHEKFQIRIHTARELAKSPDLIIIFRDRIAAVVSDCNHAVRQSFYTNVVVDDQTASVIMPLLYEALASPTAVDRLAAAELLTKHATRVNPSKLKDALAKLSTDLGNNQSSRRGSAGMAMEYLSKFPETEAAARETLASGSPLAQAMAGLVLWRLHKPFKLKHLSTAIKSDSEAAQLTICGLIGQMRTIEGVPLLRTAVSSRSGTVRSAAIYALRSLAMVSTLSKVAMHPNGFPLTALRMRDPNTPEEKALQNAALAILELALEHDDANVREKAANALGRVAASRSLTRLKKLLNDPDPKVRTAAKTSINVLHKSPTSDHLIDLKSWRQDRSKRQRYRVNEIHRHPTTIDNGVVQVASTKQLLIDDFVIETTTKLSRRLHPFKKHPRNPVFESQVPWEEGWADPFMSTITYDPTERTFRMWYRCGPRHSLAGFAVSEDGIHWQRPNIALEPYEGYQHHNLLGFEGHVATWKVPGRNVIFRADAAVPEDRYTSFFYRPHDKKYVVSKSADGVRWSNPVITRDAHGDVVSVIRNSATKKYLMFPKCNRVHEGFRRRSFAAYALDDLSSPARYNVPFLAGLREDAEVARGASRAFGSLLPETLNLKQFHTEIYSVSPINYEGLFIGLYDLWAVMGAAEGPLDMPMKVSRDMRTWQDVDFPRRALEIGRFGEWDSGMVYGASNMLVIDDEIRLYYLGANMGHYTRVLPMTRPYHSLGVGLATLRLDGFTSMQASDNLGTLTTRPLKFQGTRLEVNANTTGGSLRVELLDAAGKPIKGFTQADCIPISNDNIRHKVQWRGSPDLSRLQGQTVRLKFSLEQGDLFAFQFRS
jgi:HEAT repeat protein